MGSGQDHAAVPRPGVEWFRRDDRYVTDDATPPVALTIAGSDSGAGAGIQADLKAMSALGVFAATAITAVTAQNTESVSAVHVLPPEIVDAQIAAVVDDLPVAAVKTGLLGAPEIVGLVAARAETGSLPRLVVDPVLVASTGRPLVTAETVDAYKGGLLRHALMATPNLREAAVLVGLDPSEVHGTREMEELAAEIHGMGPAWVLVKGGHLPGVEHGSDTATPSLVPDVLLDGDRGKATVIEGPHVDTANTHGTGCTLSAAVAALLARGADPERAVVVAKQFVQTALEGATHWRLGGGHGPLDPFGWSRSPSAAPPVPSAASVTRPRKAAG
jgi:hydroxymethylpyrimidine/phosphomethylpyrimidine kinase